MPASDTYLAQVWVMEEMSMLHRLERVDQTQGLPDQLFHIYITSVNKAMCF